MSILRSEDPIREIKKTDPRRLDIEAAEIREAVIDAVSKTGGHLASNLGAVELTLALHKVFDAPRDRIVWDVGHQTYVHKMITGRLARMDSLRQLDGISGFPKRHESEFDCYDSGHASTSVSAALGMARARDLAGEDYSCIAVMGDGALSGGVAYEALSDAGSSGTAVIVILNDNEMSISDKVGGLGRHLERIRESSGYINFKSRIKHSLDSNSGVYKAMRTVRDIIKYPLIQGTVFEELGFKYYGPVDGHSCADLVKALAVARDIKRPVLVHVVTKKGKGFLSAEKNPTKFHSIGPFDPETATPAASQEHSSWASILGDELLRISEENDRVVAISAAMCDAVGLVPMKKKYPDRVFDVGIAEQHAVALAAGLAAGGCRPVVSIYSTFLQRAYDEIVTDVCLQSFPVIFAVDHAGVSGHDGETHQGMFDISYLSSMPNMTLLSPKDGPELREMLSYAFSLSSPCAIRYPKGNAPDLSHFGRTPMSASPEFVMSGEDVAIISDGCMLPVALGAAEMLREKRINAAVCNIRVIKPLPEFFLRNVLQKYAHAVVIEDGTLNGGLGMRVASLANSCGAGRVLCIGWPDTFVEAGSVGELRARYGLNALHLVRRTEEFLEEKA